MSILKSNISNINTIFVVGPTASGKSELAMRLAENYDGEILCADSQTIRRGMDIGTAKPSAADQARVKHHMLDIIEPYAEFSLADFLTIARPIINDIHGRGEVAVVVGGTGLYIDALFYNFELPQLGSVVALKDELEDKSVEALQQIIRDNGYVMPINDQNPRHLINVILRAGSAGVRGEPDASSLIVGISPGMGVLIRRIETRVEAMFAGGFLDEVRELSQVYGEPPREFDAIGYKIALRHIHGDLSEAEAKDLFKLRDRQYAKRQISWLRRNKHIRWYTDPNEAYDAIIGS